MVTDGLLGRAHAAEREVHAWTIDGPEAMGELIDHGVGGLITNAPVAALRAATPADRYECTEHG